MSYSDSLWSFVLEQCTHKTAKCQLDRRKFDCVAHSTTCLVDTDSFHCLISPALSDSVHLSLAKSRDVKVEFFDILLLKQKKIDFSQLSH